MLQVKKFNDYYITGKTIAGNVEIPVVSTVLNRKDLIGAAKVRWSVGRDNYMVKPGLYATGNPGAGSDIFVTANYKLSFDHLRKNLTGTDSWILVLDTKGVNVWCAAGKGTFGTKELITRIREANLHNIVTHNRIFVPQLGATGVSAHEVKAETGFRIIFGPVRASDIKAFIEAGYVKSEEMRTVKFGFADRLKLIPFDFVYGIYYLLAAMAVFFILNILLKANSDSVSHIKDGLFASFIIFTAYFSGIVAAPLLLPYIPFRSFAIKGFVTGVLTMAIYYLAGFSSGTCIEFISWTLIVTSVSSFLALNFTGSSTFTSLSGVQKEMRIAIPVLAIQALTGTVLLITSYLI